MNQLHAVENRLTQLDAAMHRLVREGDSAQQTTSLLSALCEQNRNLKEASAALAEVDALHDRLTAKAARWQDALANWSALEDKALAAAEQTPDAVDAIAEIARVQADLVAEGERSPEAQRAISLMGELRQFAATLYEDACDIDLALGELASIQDRVLEQRNAAGPIAAALSELARVAGLAVDASADSVAARDSVIALAEIKSMVLSQADTVDTARDRVAGLVALQDQVVSQTDDLADAIETLELTTDLRKQLDDVLKSCGRLRQWMTEIVLMEPAIGRTLTALQPLADLGNLRRMSHDELRRAARVVADGREERTATLDSKPATTPAAD